MRKNRIGKVKTSNLGKENEDSPPSKKQVSRLSRENASAMSKGQQSSNVQSDDYDEEID